MNDASHAQLHAEPNELPQWYRSLLLGMADSNLDELARFQQPAGTDVRHSAVLILFGEGPAGPDVLLIERASDMRSHAGQPAFPGGMEEVVDSGPIATALREAREEVCLQPEGVTIVATLPSMWIPPSGFVVTPVLGWWRDPSPVAVGDPAEVAAVHRVPLSEMLNPANRVKVSHPAGYIGAGFRVRGMLVWGFTGMLLDRLFSLAKWEEPWEEHAATVPFDDGWRVAKGADDPDWLPK